MIVWGDKIGIEPSDGFRTAHIAGKGIVTVDVNRVNEAAKHASRVIYNALDKKAVDILLHSNARKMICYPFVSYQDEFLELTDVYESYLKYNDMAQDNVYRLMSLLVNRAVVATNWSIGQAWSNMINGEIPQVNIETNSYSEIAVEIEKDTLNNIYCIAKISDKLWSKGYYIKGVTDYISMRGACIVGIGKAMTDELSNKNKEAVLNILQYATRGKVKNAEIIKM